ncbi:hypothetical protein SASPL_102783 [Salvia splendens]|uniref:Uncharacterized protein n=1 Tax=Salvia splendens TaxID=180675 RepID=A0A8X8YXZ9_SALSN|nr:hypothetical protein SASPL_102783 [Salvia splendens]
MAVVMAAASLSTVRSEATSTSSREPDAGVGEVSSVGVEAYLDRGTYFLNVTLTATAAIEEEEQIRLNWQCFQKENGQNGKVEASDMRSQILGCDLMKMLLMGARAVGAVYCARCLGTGEYRTGT